jgi:hypothetical protein
MVNLNPMPAIRFDPEELLPFGRTWYSNGENLGRTPPHSSIQLGAIFDSKVANSLAVMLGSIPVATPSSTSLVPEEPNCVEKGACRIIGGVRPQNFDVVYRPDGVRFAFDSKTLNDKKSVQKNYQNMINDLSTEATTVHIRYPYAVVAFLVAIPTPCLVAPQRQALKDTLERLSQRFSPLDVAHKAEAIALLVWDPATGETDSQWPEDSSPLRLEKLSDQIARAYQDRYKGLPPHD